MVCGMKMGKSYFETKKLCIGDMTPTNSEIPFLIKIKHIPQETKEAGSYADFEILPENGEDTIFESLKLRESYIYSSKDKGLFLITLEKNNIGRFFEDGNTWKVFFKVTKIEAGL